MPWRSILARDLAEFLGVLAHPIRVRIVQELREGEVDVNGLQALLDVSHSRVSQHLSVMRTHRIVAERRDGRHVYYRLVQPKLPAWLEDGLGFLGMDVQHEKELQNALKESKAVWSKEAPTS